MQQALIVSRVGKMPTGLQAHLTTTIGPVMHNRWTTSIHEELRADAPKTWRTMYKFTTKRFNKDRRTLDQQIAQAQDIAQGKRSMAKARFVSIKGKNVGINQADIDRARALPDIKGYVTSASQEILTDSEVIAHYHALFEVEAAFRLTKHDLEARRCFTAPKT